MLDIHCIVDARPYGNTCVVKKECINHVQKRMGSRLRALKKSSKGLGGKGRLTDKIINDLTNYYGLAIRRNSKNIHAMYNAIWMTLYHKSSTSGNPRHYLCPEGTDSWCRFQSAFATGNLNTFTDKPPLPEDVVEAIFPIYEDLSKPELLARCVGGYTQNNNECFNSLVWQIAPKSTSGGAVIVEIALNLSTIIFNDGTEALLKIFGLFGIEIGPTLQQYCVKHDENRVSRAESRAKSSLLRSKSCSKKLQHSADRDDNMGERPFYGPGIDEI